MSRVEHLKLQDVVFIGRTFEEYLRMFHLSREELHGKRILDCPAGACSFTAHASRFGAAVTAADLAYGLPPDILAEKGKADLEVVRKGMINATANYVWHEFQTVEGLISTRQRALEDFIADYQQHRDRYVHTVLPQLPFPDDAFDLVLSAHFLFTYADRLDFSFHMDTIREMLRTAREVRIFPLVGAGGQRYPYLDRIATDLQAQGYHVHISQVPYHFQRHANEMLRVIRPTLANGEVQGRVQEFDGCQCEMVHQFGEGMLE